ncbi:MAG: tRNA (adenosine(37)-N6)-threonylcarbamoyltransferase complex ATPase subunit type 1 TsaE [Verrucomicrobiota bacterium]
MKGWESGAKRVVGSAEAMISLGAELGGGLLGGEVIGLAGPLGAGKTHFVKGLAAGVGCRAEVTSPTFTLVHEYLGGKFPIYHFDFYRLETELELEDLGWEDYVEGDRGVVVVEWANRYARALPEGALWWEIGFGGDEDKREVFRR